ncbi:hypothetical protein [Cohnella rhizosphaerae]|uniref:HTH araC/xylS-type domain-containing protein n=1 Tax=Cohnella rhizosphaerae TaxID=1457232 RepID=A0A9X4KXA1_9BACL|nr:hypothetical protein [Cohnella rhizosphaerae]MDG0812976.1 hypothetical protein [Cohnella rhizosphaerae]
MERAKELMAATQMKSYDIAVEVGFSPEYTYFSKVFKKSDGLKPQRLPQAADERPGGLRMKLPHAFRSLRSQLILSYMLISVLVLSAGTYYVYTFMLGQIRTQNERLAASTVPAGRSQRSRRRQRGGSAVQPVLGRRADSILATDDIGQGERRLRELSEPAAKPDRDVYF